MTAPRLGRVQLLIMHILWEKRRATAREITDILNQSEAIAHSTVQTLLRKMEVKGAIDHDIQDRTFVFRPLVGPDKVRQRATREFVDRLFGGSLAGLVAYLLRSERIPRRELDKIRRLIRESASEAPAGRPTNERKEK